jgi:aminobenzoyl-glutamate utilization protein B
MKRNIILSLLLVLICNALFGQIEVQQVEKLKAEAAAEVEKYAVLGQQINDMLFSFSELGFQEYETFNYLTSLLEKQGFKVEKGIAGVPTAWIATWGSGKPVIALGSDVDCIPKASQKPGVAYQDPYCGRGTRSW